MRPAAGSLRVMNSPDAKPARLVSLDAYRGLVMFLLFAECLNIGEVARALPDSAFWAFLHSQQEHVEWACCVLHDLIQPSFSFLVGAACAFSVASRRLRQSLGGMIGHAWVRALILVLFGFFQRSIGHRSTNFTFDDTLTLPPR